MKVNIFDFADMAGLNLDLRRYATQNRWMAKFEKVELSVGGGLLSEYGDGTSVDSAISDYCNRIRGKKGIQYAMEKTLRREVNFPIGLCYEGTQ